MAAMDGLEFETDEPVNVLGGPLQVCGMQPLTGFFRDGCCNTSGHDYGQHTVCCVVTKAFLQYSRFRGNDLSTPRPDVDFPGLREGDRWCLCAMRWWEAHQFGMAPGVVLEATHIRALEIIPLHVLQEHAVSASDASTRPAVSPPQHSH